MKKIACFISPHGFGHATRCCGVLSALSQYIEITPHLFTTVNRDLFRQNLPSFSFTEIPTDIGFAQQNPFDIDIDETLSRLSRFLPFEDNLVTSLAEKCRDMDLILCDISALGIAVGNKAGVPSVLIENFTWDWIYNACLERRPQLNLYSEQFNEIYNQATYRIQTEPVCRKVNADITCGPICRPLRNSKGNLRQILPLQGRHMVLITLGGFPHKPAFLNEMRKKNNFYFIIPGQEKDEKVADNIEFLSLNTNFYHPDLINAADITIFKLGYSTLAECYQCGTPAICVQRNGFAESRVLANFASSNMGAILISEDTFMKGKWLSLLDDIPLKKTAYPHVNGATEAASFLLKILNK